MIKHKWQIDGQQFDFCVKCGRLKNTCGPGCECRITDKEWKNKHPHSFKWVTYNYRDGSRSKAYICQKCRRAYKGVVIYYRKFDGLNMKSSGKILTGQRKYYYKSLIIPCTMSHNDYLIKDIIE